MSRSAARRPTWTSSSDAPSASTQSPDEPPRADTDGDGRKDRREIRVGKNQFAEIGSHSWGTQEPAWPLQPGRFVVPITTETVQALAEAVRERYRALVLLGAGTGPEPGRTSAELILPDQDRGFLCHLCAIFAIL
jgi:hypothetical protein